MKIAFVCDIHLPKSKESPQYVFFKRAVEKIKLDGVKILVNLGDITACGELEALDNYLSELGKLEHYYVLGNSDVRDDNTLDSILDKKSEPCFELGTKKILGINTPYGIIDESDRERLQMLDDGDVVFLHHYVRSLQRESRSFFEKILSEKKLTVFHGHAHYFMDMSVGRSRVLGLRALDPDKSIGDYPCITYVDITEESITFDEQLFAVGEKAIFGVRNHFGISCVDNRRDLGYAIEHGVKNVEIRCRKASDIDYSIIPLVESWRERGGEYLSLHMPDIKFKDGEFSAVEQWNDALGYAKALGVNGLTIHPPKAKVCEVADREVYESFLTYYAEAVELVGDSVHVGIENMHMTEGEKNDRNRYFGCSPEEVLSWIDAINERLGKKGRVGHTLDVGHARNNGIIASTDPISRWYEKMGNRTVAYHIHQTVKEGKGLKNHCPINDWFGPMISYVSFLYAWDVGMIDRVPVFLEVKGAENYDVSVKAFEENLIKKL